MCLTVASQVQLGMRPQFHAYLAVVFFATLLDYTFHRFNRINNTTGRLNSEKYQWAAGHRNLMKTIIYASLTCLVFLLFWVSIHVVFFLLPLAAVTLLYSAPNYKKRMSSDIVQHIPGLKTILLAFVWAAVTILLPVLQSGDTFVTARVVWVFAERFTFVLALAIPFDIRDIKADTLAGIKTLTVVLGEKKSLRASNTLLFLSICLALVHYAYQHMIFILLAYALSGAVALFMINTKKLKTQKLYYHGILDGSIMLHGILICISFFFRIG